PAAPGLDLGPLTLGLQPPQLAAAGWPGGSSRGGRWSGRGAECIDQPLSRRNSVLPLGAVLRGHEDELTVDQLPFQVGEQPVPDRFAELGDRDRRVRTIDQLDPAVSGVDALTARS